MLTRFFWNKSFEDLMASVSTWMKEQATIEIVHADWKYAHPTGDNSGKWYFVVLYKQ